MFRALLIVFCSVALAGDNLPAPANRTVDFKKDVRPLLAEKCYGCHGPAAQQSGLRLDLRQAALRGGDYGPVIKVGDSAGSKLIRRLVNGDGGLQMPPTGPLSAEEIGILRAWIDQGADFPTDVLEEAPPKPVDPKLATLISAVRTGDSSTAARLLATAPELVTARDPAGNTPLHHAAGFGNIAVMKLLLDRKADPNAVNGRKSTPLFWALYDEAKVRLLLDHGANVNARAIDGRTPVFLAASMANAVPVLRILLDRGGDPNSKTLPGMTPLMAAAGANPEALRLLVQRNAAVNAVNSAGFTALMAAARTGSPDAVRLLLDHGADPNLHTKRNETALAEAATSGSEEVVKMLLDRGAGVNLADIRGYSPLLYAAASETIPVGVVKLLLAKGASLDARGDGESAGMLAAKRGDTEVARLLGVPENERRLLGVVPAPQSPGVDRSVAAAVQPALTLLEKQSYNFIRIGGCNSCHAQDLPSVAAAIARDRQLPAPQAIPQLPRSMSPLNPERIMDLVGFGAPSLGWELFNSGSNRVPRSPYTDAAVRYIKVMQTAAGNWASAEGHRPPMLHGAFQATALSAYSLKTYGPPAEAADTQAALARAASWLEASEAANTQDRAFRLLGLAWSNAKPAAVAAAAKALAATQRADGGWSQLATMGSDAYATGEALYALSVAGGLPPTDSAYTKGVKYLLTTQAPDGSWHVASRSIWLQPYFESGFPYATDQWISAAGTAWSVMALAVSVEPQRTNPSPAAFGERLGR